MNSAIFCARRGCFKNVANGLHNIRVEKAEEKEKKAEDKIKDKIKDKINQIRFGKRLQGNETYLMER